MENNKTIYLLSGIAVTIILFLSLWDATPKTNLFKQGVTFDGKIENAGKNATSILEDQSLASTPTLLAGSGDLNQVNTNYSSESMFSGENNKASYKIMDKTEKAVSRNYNSQAINIGNDKMIYSNNNNTSSSNSNNVATSSLSQLSQNLSGVLSAVVSVNSSNTSSPAEKTGFLALSSDIPTVEGSMSTDETVIQRSDPGGNPTEDPIPVPDGFWVLMFLAVMYAGWKISSEKLIKVSFSGK